MLTTVAMMTAPLLMGAELASLVEAGSSEIQQNEAVSIPGGGFNMGDDYSEYADEKPSHPVTVSPFKLGRNVVTNAAYKRWVESLGHNRSFLVGTDSQTGWPRVLAVGRRDVIEEQKDKAGEGVRVWEAEIYRPYEVLDRPHQPVSGIWYSAYLYAFMHGGRLPTEAEFEFAATKGGTQRFASASGNPLATEIHANLGGDKKTASIDVDDPRYPDGPYGLRHMAGNVSQWVMDWFDKDYYKKSPSQDPTGPASGIFKVRRGGAWNCVAEGLWAVHRNFEHPEDRFGDLGFRVAWPAH